MNKFITHNLKMNVYNNDYIHFNNTPCLLTRLAFYITLYFYNSQLWMNGIHLRDSVSLG